MRGFFCALFAGILCLESIGGFCRQGYVSEGIREQATHLFHETEEKEEDAQVWKAAVAFRFLVYSLFKI